ncbi:MAG TPA: DUF929 family protein, partial [Acidimicrobiales bacterium]|nr:DUF929 family protein [Acidimicrobiales bacterium]
GRQARQAAQRRNQLLALLAVVVVVAVVAVVVIIGVSSSGSSGKPRQAAPAAAVGTMQGVSTATLADAAAKIKTQDLNYATIAKGGDLTKDGKPEILYIGAEFCPVCAAERWPMTIALMKFGTFSNLQQTHSAKADGDAGTWSYYGATYTSKYISFNPQELYTNEPSGNYYKPLEKITPANQQVWTANEGSSLAFPFIDLGGKEVLQSAQFNPQIVYYKSFDTTLSSIGSNDNTIGAYVDASAAVFTKYICGLTNNQPGDVCTAVSKVAAPITQSNSGTSSPAG